MVSQTLQAMDQEMDVVGQNITNASTTGYSRQVAELEPMGPATGETGTGSEAAGGVEVTTVLRTHAAWLDNSAGALNGQVGSTAASAQYYSSIENLLNEPSSNGLQSMLTSFYSAFNSLANNPADGSTRDAALSATENLANTFNQLTDGLTSVGTTVTQQAQTDMASVNNLASQIADLDQQIGQAQASGSSPNTLMDQRDSLIANITNLTGATVSGQEGANVVISVAGAELVQGGFAETLQMSSTSPIGFTAQSTGGSVQFTGGSLGAESNMANTVIPGYQQQVANLAQTLATNVNNLVQSGVDGNGNPGEALFTSDSGGQLTVNPDIVASSQLLAAGNGESGDGSIAAAIGVLGTGSSAIDPAYQQMVADIGEASSNAQTASTTAQSSLTQVQAMQASESGVNVDQELSNMISLQQSYAAAAKLLSTYDSMLDTLMQATSPTA
jgi:flagellar hook-associated protein 1 FlgK